ncbi:MAG: hypothetical protein NVS2B14_19360 [Chamaesiphon sp.]
MAIIKFPVNELFKALVSHAANSEKHEPTLEQREDDGLTPETTPSALLLVKDANIYLMSNGLPALPPSKNAVYGVGFSGNVNYESLSEDLVGDNFVLPLPIEWAEKAILNKKTHMRVKLISDIFSRKRHFSLME